MPLENQIRREDIGYRLAKAVELKGQGTPTLQLDTNVVPVILVQDITRGDNLDYQTNRWCRGWGSSPAAAQFGKLSFNNHADSGILAKIYSIDIFHAGIVVSDLQVGVLIETSSTGGTQVNFTKGFTDARMSFGNTGLFTPGRLPTLDIRTDNSGGIGAHFIRPSVRASGGWHIDLGGWVLRPGTRLHFEALTLNAEYNAHVEWTETNL